MNAETQSLRAIDECLADGNETDAKPFQAPGKNSARSQRNIDEWQAYLPKECVAAMIAMGWDETT